MTSLFFYKTTIMALNKTQNLQLHQSQNIVTQLLFSLKNMLAAPHPTYSMLRECENCFELL